jgi:molybdopterin biosynthesis enzyme
MFIFPGNPASASICIELFFDIFLNNIYYEEKYRLIDATAKFSLNKKKGFYKLIPGFFEIDGDKIMFFDRSTKYNKRKLGFAIAVIKKEQESLKSGETIKIYTSL